MKNYLMAIFLIIIFFMLTSCTINGTQVIAKQLQPTELIKIHNTTPPSLAPRSKCSTPPSIRLVNAETNHQDHTIYTWWPTEVYITPKKLVDDIIIYMGDAFNRAGIKTDQGSAKIIHVSLEKLTSWYTVFNFSADTKLKIIIPEKQSSKLYEYTDTTPKSAPTAVAYTIHQITWKIINDPFLQDYILCANEDTKSESFASDDALNILKKRYAKGEITKDQFEQMKKDIQ
ncbi:MAG TPA: SHOCT domain-containing protein [Smithellaceae bacterium]|mgnify:FL=1|nr:SHOCT domain-containing protein [Smithellaceae bacterium]